MKGSKRKAGEISEQSVFVEDPQTRVGRSPDTINQLGTMLWSWCKTLFVNGVSSASQETNQSLASFPTQEKLKSLGSENREPKSKRQKTENVEATLSRTKSLSNFRPVKEQKKIDITGYNTVQARRIIDKFWEPNPMPWIKHQSSTYQDDEADTTKSKKDLSKRRNSHPVGGHGKQDSYTLQTNINKEEHFGFQAKKRSPQQETLEETLKNLFLDTHNSFALSRYKTEQNLIREGERKEREKQAAIKQARLRRLHRSFPKQTPIPCLSTEWEDAVIKAHRSDWDEIITTSIGGTELRIKDFRTLLDHRAWLNDEIINTYIEWIVEAANKIANEESTAFGLKPGSVPKFICHNSFFYDNLRKKGPSSTDRLMKRKGVPGSSLLKVDTVFVPICSGSHWTLGVVRPLAKTIEYFDSMGGSPSAFFHHMQSWLKHQLGDSYNPNEWCTPRTACARQTNGYDCGVFVCTNAFCVAVGLETSCYEEVDMTRQRRNIAALLLNRGFHGDFVWIERDGGLFY